MRKMLAASRESSKLLEKMRIVSAGWGEGAGLRGQGFSLVLVLALVSALILGLVLALVLVLHGA